MIAEPRQAVITDLRKSAKYATLCEPTLERIAVWAIARHPRPKDAAKAAKRKLHQVFGAYLDPGAVALAERAVDELGDSPDKAALAQAADAILRHHASSKERLAGLGSFYRALWQVTGAPASVLDIACGFSPFALPMMGLPAECRYDAIDIDTRLMAVAERFRALYGQPGRIEAGDVLVDPPEKDADVALVLKTLPCLDQQETGAGARLLRQIKARTIVVTYPVRSLGGRDKNMAATYRDSFAKVTAGLGRRVDEIEGEDELVFVLTQL
ncbi:MAG: 16S rRNA methyltransferase [Pseudomonadota bacterium]